ncbi:MAG: hypothetical protein JWR19_473 [Pedosphaera sp.]|nr:hypothetical protein [Pedosphaera sp.]
MVLAESFRTGVLADSHDEEGMNSMSSIRKGCVALAGAWDGRVPIRWLAPWAANFWRASGTRRCCHTRHFVDKASQGACVSFRTGHYEDKHNVKSSGFSRQGVQGWGDTRMARRAWRGNVGWVMDWFRRYRCAQPPATIWQSFRLRVSFRTGHCEDGAQCSSQDSGFEVGEDD